MRWILTALLLSLTVSMCAAIYQKGEEIQVSAQKLLRTDIPPEVSGPFKREAK
jgi:hypothetical protein